MRGGEEDQLQVASRVLNAQETTLSRDKRLRKWNNYTTNSIEPNSTSIEPTTNSIQPTSNLDRTDHEVDPIDHELEPIDHELKRIDVHLDPNHYHLGWTWPWPKFYVAMT